MDRIDLYLQWGLNKAAYVNTEEEQKLLNKFVTLYTLAKSAQDNNELVSPKNLAKWRKAYYGTLNALNRDGTESKRKGRKVRNMIYEFVEAKIDNNIPQPRMIPKYKSDLPLVEITDDYLKYNTDTIFTKYLNDRSERATYVDGTSWYKVWWDNMANSHTCSGRPKVDILLADQVIPQPGILDWRKLEYIFELQQVSLARIYDLYGRIITPVASDQSQPSDLDKHVDMSTVTVVTCYYLNSDRIVGRFMWSLNTMQVIANEPEWLVRKLRTCKRCKQVVPQSENCPICGSKEFEYKIADTDILDEPLSLVYNPYDVGETDDESLKDQYATKDFLPAGAEVPFYKIRQLPFVPRPAVSSIESLYGISEAATLLEMQDCANKTLSKMVDKTLKSGAVITKPKKLKINDTDESFKVLDVSTFEEAQMVQAKQILADTSQDIAAAQLLYESAKASSGVTASFQGKEDSTATSGKAKEFAAAQTAGRIESLRIMKAAAFAGVYELLLKFLLAFSDEPRKFVKVLPNGKSQQEEWNKYMFLAKDDYGEIYYRDDFEFSTDAASTLSTNRVAMWQEIRDHFIQGALGDPSNMRTMELYWTLMEQEQYPLAKLALAGIQDNSQHLPQELEQLLLNNPQVLQQAMATLQDSGQMEGPGSSQHGGARPGSGPDGNGATHASNVERTNERNRASQREVASPIQNDITMQGGNT